MQDNGFQTQEIKTKQWWGFKDKMNVPKELRSCHTGVVDGYFLEGHIPASDVQRLLREKPKDVIGLAVPNMPQGSPGMEQGREKESYNVYYVKKDGSYGIWMRYNNKEKK